ncbi:MAG: hypothetical protein ACUVXA_00715 [Candidatus Jordarchaeum sp.]|uniref:hypothetical protein n=1 Tax=Candidatus Jordarchaeum sp. TaxID=2823881 RepID=UPI004049C0D4
MITEKTALEYLNDAREHLKNVDYTGAFLRYIRAGCFFRESSDLVTSFDCYNKAMQLFPKYLNKPQYTALVYSGFASYYRGVGKSDKFLEYLSESVKMHVKAAEESLTEVGNKGKKKTSLISLAISEYSWASFCSFLLGEKELAKNLAVKVAELLETKRLKRGIRELAKTCEALFLRNLDDALFHWVRFQEKLSNDYFGETQYYEYIRIVENCFNIVKSGEK